jgi:hypothetical protein
MKGKWLVLAVIVCGSAFAADFSLGIRIGAPPPPRVVAVRPPSPGSDFINGHYRWHEGYWTRPPHPGAVWVVPHHDGERFFAGYWNGDRGRMEHDHRWDRDRDYRHDHDDHDRDRH